MTRALRLPVLVLLLSACASTPTPPPESAGFEAHRDSLQALQEWSFSGRIAVRTAGSADSASLKWRQSGDDLEMALSGPVGIKEAILSRRDGRLVLQQNGERRSIPQSEDPLLEEFGWSLPLDYLPFWLRGLPAPGLPIDRQGFDGGRLARLSQAGWNIEYTEYQEVSGRALPRRIQFSRADISGKILLKEWQL